MSTGKRVTKAREGIDPAKAYSLDDAVKLVKERAKAKFDETVEIAMNLGVDPRHADQMVRGVVELRVEKAGIIQAGVGKASFSAEKLAENIRAFTDAVNKAKPAGAKGHYVNRVAISSTMGPGVKVDLASLAAPSGA